MANNQIIKYDDFQYGDLSHTDIQVIHETIANDCSEPQFKLFMTIAKNLGANPILNEIYPTVIQGKLTPQFGIGLYVKRARQHADYRGYDVQLVYENDTFKMHQERDEGDDGRYYVVIDEHSWSFPRGRIIGCYAFAYREGFKPFSVIMGIEEVEHYQRSSIGMQKTMWTNQLPDMFKKHVSKRALNAAFGLGMDDEVGSNGGNVQEYEPQRKDITNEAQEITPEPKQEPVQNVKTDDSKALIAKEKEKMKEKFKALGLTTKEAMGEYLGNNAKFKDPANPTLAEMKALLKIMDMHIAEKQAADDDLLNPLE